MTRILFGDGNTNRSFANISHAKTNLYAYAKAYKTAGDILVEEYRNMGPIRDALAFPIIYNYRHYIEVSLKAINADLLKFSKSTPPNKINHKIDDLWKITKQDFDKVMPIYGSQSTPYVKENEIASVDKLISQITQVDPYATDFKYSKRKKNEQSLSDVEYIDIKNFKKEIENVCSVFDYQMTLLDLFGSTPY